MKQLYNEIKDLDKLTIKYKNDKIELNLLINEIQDLKDRRANISLNALKSKISELEFEYREIFREIDCMNILINKCLNLKELKNIIATCEDERICLKKKSSTVTNIVIIHSFL